jgi:hypothetical protein
MMKREFVVVKTYKYDFKGRVVKQTKHVVEAVDDSEDVVGESEAPKKNLIGFQYEADTEKEICEEDDEE